MPKKQKKAAPPMAIPGVPEEHRVKGRRIGDMSIKDIVAMREAPGVTAFDQQMLTEASMNRLLGQVSDRLCLPPDLISELVFGGGADDEDELEEVDVLAGITYLWCTQQGLILLFSSAKGFLTTFESVQAVLLVASAVCARSTSRWYTGCAVLNLYEGGDSCPFEKTCCRGEERSTKIDFIDNHVVIQVYFCDPHVRDSPGCWHATVYILCLEKLPFVSACGYRWYPYV